jgi:cysteine dioxygenase
MGWNLDTLFGYLDHLHGRAPLEELVDQMKRIDLTCADVADFIRFSDRQYSRNLMRAGDWYYALILCWKNGQRSPIHDHAGSSCGVRVLRGTLTETRFGFAPNHHVKAMASNDYPMGSVIGSEDSDMHQVSNLQDGGADLVTLHIYSPPLVRMGTYSIFDQSRGHEMMLLEFSDAAGI